MRYISCLLLLALAACESQNYEADKRQILAKNALRKQLRSFNEYSIIGFKEDTLQTWTDSVIIHPIRYSINFNYKDSTGILQYKTGEVTFTSQGNAILRTQITDSAPPSE